MKSWTVHMKPYVPAVVPAPVVTPQNWTDGWRKYFVPTSTPESTTTSGLVSSVPFDALPGSATNSGCSPRSNAKSNA